MITTHIVTITCNSPYYPRVKDLGSQLSKLGELGRIVSVFPFGNPQPPRTHDEYCVVVEQEDPVVVAPTVDNDLASRLEKLAKAAETGPWFAGKIEDEDGNGGSISIGGYDLEESVAMITANHHYENTILEVWNNGNIAGDVESTAALLCELVNNLPTIIKALRD